MEHTIRFASTDRLKIAYFDTGDTAGPAILLLHGWPDDATAWERTVPHLTAAGYRVIIPYLRGFGETRFHNAATPRTGNSVMHAIDIVGLLDALAVDQLYIAGHDWGSNIAESIAVNWPEKVLKAAFLATPLRLGGLPTPPFAHAQLEWYHWFQATKRGQEAIKHDPICFAHIMWENWSPKGWFDEATFSAVAKSWQNDDFVPVTLHSYQSRWDEAEPDPDSKGLGRKG